MAADTLTPPESKPNSRPENAGTDGATAADDIANQGIETLKRTSDTLSHMGGQYIAIYSDTLAAAVESATQTSKLVSEMSKSYMDAYGSSTATMAEIGREALTCRTSDDFVKLHKRAMESLAASMEAKSKLYSDMLASCSKAFEPLFARVSDAPERLFRAIAN